MVERSLLASVLMACCCAHLGVAQPENLCYAFLRSADLHVACGKGSGQITHRRDIERFAVSEEQAYLAFLTSQITKRTATLAEAVYTTTLVDLRSGRLSQTAGQAFGDNTLVGTCGGIFRAADPRNEHSGSTDLITGAQIDMSPYRWFVCSSDLRVVFGNLGAPVRGTPAGP